MGPEAAAGGRSGDRPILRADWLRLVIASWAVRPALLEPALPRGLRLARLGGEAFASLVAFDFERLRIRGVSLPGLDAFPEINIRTYVETGDRFGVLFLREFVPRWLVVAGARLLYNEPYQRAAMRSRSREDKDGIEIDHDLTRRGSAIRMRVRAGADWRVPSESSEEHFFKEHEWGFGADRRGRAIAYRVRHARWAVATLREWSIEVDWAGLMGPAWRSLEAAEPASVFLADGSWAEVYAKERLA